MIGGMVHPLDTMVFGPIVSKIDFEMSPIVRLGSSWSTMSPQDLLLKAQDSVLGSGMTHEVCFQPPGGCFCHCKHIVLTLGGLRQCNRINLPSLPVSIFLLLSPIPQWLSLII